MHKTLLLLNTDRGYPTCRGVRAAQSNHKFSGGALFYKGQLSEVTKIVGGNLDYIVSPALLHGLYHGTESTGPLDLAGHLN